MIEIMYSDQIQISDLTLINSPTWFVHPIYSRFDKILLFFFFPNFLKLLIRFHWCIVCFTILIKLYIFSNIIVKGLTILAPVDSPNTDGINPGKIVCFQFILLELATLGKNHCQIILTNFSLLHRFMHKHQDWRLLHCFWWWLHFCKKWLGWVWN